MTDKNTHVVNLGTPQRPAHFPAWDRPDGLLVDLRLFRSLRDGADQDNPERVYDPARLRQAGIAEEIIEAAAESSPAGFLLLPRGV